ncbi:DUF4192 family protein [Kitasatospora sp. RB6PN24]|uniref:DUF4192 domain-containing protein n=1 Tax=Kitasatospora humi TaxID=2893891 RepID=UPI001E3BDC7E|nr:DUF4192 domain-containing protein [Kitasatospora humi]MCC9309221.1 DUF4192 family protein [Kitasatospora humi]
MTHDDSTAPASRLAGFQLLQMRGPADMAAMLPYLLGFYPDDSLVAVGLHGPQLQQGGAIRLDIPEEPQLWSAVATDFARLLVELSEQRDRRPEAVLLYLCRDPEPDSPAVVSSLRPLADHLLRAFRELDIPVKESLCISGGRWWSFLCADPACCPSGGTPVYSSQEPRAVVAAATYAGLAPRGSRRAIAAGLAPIGPPEAEAQRAALAHQTALACERLMVEPFGAARTVAATAELLEQAMAECRSGSPQLDPERSARLIVGLLDKVTRDRAAEYAEPEELAAAQRLWRYLARRCVAPYSEYAKVPLTLLAWTSWLARDTATARVALGMALELDSDYTLAVLLYESLNTGLAPEGLLGIVRGERARRAAEASAGKTCGAASDPLTGSHVDPPDESPEGRRSDGAEGSPGRRDSPGDDSDVSEAGGRPGHAGAPGGRGSATSGATPMPEASHQSSDASRQFGSQDSSGSGPSLSSPAAGAKPGEAGTGHGGSTQSMTPPARMPRQRMGAELPPSAADSSQLGDGPSPAARQAGPSCAAGHLRRLRCRTARRRPGCCGGSRRWNEGGERA